MSKAILTRERVFAAAAELQQQGREINGYTVREHLGGGSFSTAKALVDEWLVEQAQQQTATIETPDEVLQAAQALARQVWHHASIMADQRVAEAAEVATAQVAAARAAQSQAEQMVTRLEAEAEEVLRQLADLQRQADDAQCAHAAAQQTQAIAEARAIELAGRVDDLKAQLDREHAARREAEQRATAPLADEIAAIKAELARLAGTTSGGR